MLLISLWICHCHDFSFNNVDTIIYLATEVYKTYDLVKSHELTPSLKILSLPVCRLKWMKNAEGLSTWTHKKHFYCTPKVSSNDGIWINKLTSWPRMEKIIRKVGHCCRNEQQHWRKVVSGDRTIVTMQEMNSSNVTSSPWTVLQGLHLVEETIVFNEVFKRSTPLRLMHFDICSRLNTGETVCFVNFFNFYLTMLAHLKNYLVNSKQNLVWFWGTPQMTVDFYKLELFLWVISNHQQHK